MTKMQRRSGAVSLAKMTTGEPVFTGLQGNNFRAQCPRRRIQAALRVLNFF